MLICGGSESPPETQIPVYTKNGSPILRESASRVARFVPWFKPALPQIEIVVNLNRGPEIVEITWGGDNYCGGSDSHMERQTTLFGFRVNLQSIV